MAATGLRRPDAQKLLGRFLFSGWEEHEKPVDGALGRRAAAARARARRRERREPPRARRADEPPRPREPRGARGGARGVPRHRAARHARPRAARRRLGPRARDRGPASSSPTPAAGPSTCAAASAEAAAAEPKPRKPKRGAADAASGRAAPTPLELVEREIARSEERVAELERQLADDWTNVDLVAAHRAARDDLRRCSRAGKRSSRPLAQERSGSSPRRRRRSRPRTPRTRPGRSAGRRSPASARRGA